MEPGYGSEFGTSNFDILPKFAEEHNIKFSNRLED
jgi:hypothetical protein